MSPIDETKEKQNDDAILAILENASSGNADLKLLATGQVMILGMIASMIPRSNKQRDSILQDCKQLSNELIETFGLSSSS